MKFKLIILLFTAFTFQNATYAQEAFASTIKLGPFSLDMKNAEVNKICENKITKAEFKNSAESLEKKVKVIVNGIEYKLGFYYNYDKDGNLDGTYNLVKVESTDQKIKTKSGIGIGMDKFDVLKKLNGMNVSYSFNKSLKYDDDGNPTNKFIEYIEIIDNTAHKTLMLKIDKEKISGFELSVQEDGC
jgi:hypothetical protein